MKITAKTTSNKKFGQWFLSQRKGLGIQQMAFAKKMGISQSKLSKLENGTLTINVGQAVCLLSLLGKSLTQLGELFETEYRHGQRYRFK